jgi:hypothetical protein
MNNPHLPSDTLSWTIVLPTKTKGGHYLLDWTGLDYWTDLYSSIISTPILISLNSKSLVMASMARTCKLARKGLFKPHPYVYHSEPYPHLYALVSCACNWCAEWAPDTRHKGRHALEPGHWKYSPCILSQYPVHIYRNKLYNLSIQLLNWGTGDLRE